LNESWQKNEAVSQKQTPRLNPHFEEDDDAGEEFFGGLKKNDSVVKEAERKNSKSIHLDTSQTAQF
jgi:hypothetical protein